MFLDNSNTPSRKPIGMVKISELRDGLKKVDVDGVITDIYPQRQIKLKDGTMATLNEYRLDDMEGHIKLVLWNRNVKLEKGDRIRVKNGFVTSYKGELSLNVGKFGEIIKSTT